MAINHFVKDTEEINSNGFVTSQGSEAVSKHWEFGSEGSVDLARRVSEIDSEVSDFAPIYPDEMPLAEKIQTICKIYRADEALMDKKIHDQLRQWEEQGYGGANLHGKNSIQLFNRPNLRGAPTGHTVPVRKSE